MISPAVRAHDTARRSTAQLGGSLAAAAVLLAAFTLLAGVVRISDGPTSVDEHVLSWLLAHRSGTGDAVFRVVTALGSGPLVVMVAALGAAFLWRVRDRVRAVTLFVMLAGAGVLTVTMKHLVGRVRPPAAVQSLPVETGLSFPSGHTLFAVTVWCGVALLLSRHVAGRAGRFLLVFGAVAVSLLVALSRLYLGYHWLTDVIGSLLLGAAWVLTCRAAGVRALLRTKRREAGTSVSSQPR